MFNFKLVIYMMKLILKWHVNKYIDCACAYCKFLKQRNMTCVNVAVEFS